MRSKVTTLLVGAVIGIVLGVAGKAPNAALLGVIGLSYAGWWLRRETP
jgi:hypothetical protein